MNCNAIQCSETHARTGAALFFANAAAAAVSAAHVDSFRTVSYCTVACCVVQVRLMLPGDQTMLGDAAAEAELFMTDGYVTVSTR